MNPLNRTRTWMKAAALGVVGILAASLPVLAQDASRLTEVTANPQDNQILLNLSAVGHATLLTPLQNNERRLLVDIQGASLPDDLDKAALLESLKSQLPDVSEISLDEFRGTTPLVRLVVKTRNPATTGALLKNHGTTLVLQIIRPFETDNTATAKESPGDNTLTFTHQNPNTATAPEKSPPAPPPEQPKTAPPVATQPVKPVPPVTAPSPGPDPSGVSTAKPDTTPPPGHVAPPPRETGEASTPSLVEQVGEKLSNTTLTAKTSRLIDDYKMQRKQYEADSLRRERNILRDQVENLKRLVDQQHRMIAHLKDEQAKLARNPSNREEIDRIQRLQQDLEELYKSYEQMKEIIAAYRNEVTQLEAQLQAAEGRNEAMKKELAYKPAPITFPDPAELRAGLLNTLDSLSDPELEKLLEAEKAFRKGKRFEFDKDYAKAESHYKSALQRAPQVLEYSLSLATMYTRQKAWDKAEDVFLAALKFHPDDTTLLNELGKLAMIKKDESLALKYFKKALPAGIINNYASALRRAENFSDAEAFYKLAISLNPDDSDLHFNLGNLYLTQKRYSEAQSRYDEALKLNPGFAEARYHLGLAFAQQGNTQKAIEELRKYLQDMPEAPNKQQVQDYIRDLERVSKS